MNLYHQKLLIFLQDSKFQDILQFHRNNWEKREDFQNGTDNISRLTVISDVAERVVKLIQEYNGLLTKSENQKQYLLQIVSDYKTCYPKDTRINKYVVM